MDHPLLIAIPLGSGGDSLVLSVPWLQYLPLLAASGFAQPPVFASLTKAFPPARKGQLGSEGEEESKSERVVCSAYWCRVAAQSTVEKPFQKWKSPPR